MMKQYTPRIILWDVHEVLFTRNLVHWVWTILHYPHKWRVIKSLDWHVIKLVILYIIHITHIKRIEMSSQELIDYARRTGKQELVDLTVRVACDYTPITGVIKIVEQLHALGYKQHIASNIGSTVLATFRIMYPDIFCYFDVIQVVHYEGKQLIKKPDTRFFVNYCLRHSLKTADILFVDDKQYNIAAAEQIGIRGIVFKSAAQLTAALQEHNIPVH
jgi:FMN phosphatase YigB (HAD superfamily)